VFATLQFGDGKMAHFHMSWLDPHKAQDHRRRQQEDGWWLSQGKAEALIKGVQKPGTNPMASTSTFASATWSSVPADVNL